MRARLPAVKARPPGRSRTYPLVVHALSDPAAEPRAVVLVEGPSDRAALQALAERHQRDLDAEGVSVVAIGGAQAVGQFLGRLGRAKRDVRLAGLCDAGEEYAFRRALERAGLGSDLTREDMPVVLMLSLTMIGMPSSGRWSPLRRARSAARASSCAVGLTVITALSAGSNWRIRRR